MQANAKQDALMQYAEAGARVRLTELEQERQDILTMFPRLKKILEMVGGTPAPAKIIRVKPVKLASVRKPMSKKRRNEVRKRMLAFWAAKRKEAKAKAA